MTAMSPWKPSDIAELTPMQLACLAGGPDASGGRSTSIAALVERAKAAGEEWSSRAC